MQINGVGNNQIGNSYQNPNRMPNSTTGKKEDEDINKRLEALGVKVELSFQQPGPQEQEARKETVEAESPQEAFSVVSWIKKIWNAGIAWLKSIWNDEQSKRTDEADLTSQEMVDVQEDAMQAEMSGVDADVAESEMFDANPELVAEVPLDEGADYAAMHVKEQKEPHAVFMSMQMPTQAGQFEYRTGEDDQTDFTADKYRTVGTPLHTSGMQDSYNRYGQHSKLGVEPTNNMTVRK